MKTKKNHKTENRRLHSGFRCCFRVYAVTALMLCMAPCLATVASAIGTNGAVNAINNLTDLFFSLLKGVGVIAAAFGVLQFAMSFQSHDPTQRTSGILVFVGGIIIFFIKEILASIGVSI